MPWLLVFAGAAQPVPENEAAELVARIEQAAGPRNATLLGSDRLIEFEGRFVTTARLEPTEKPDDPYRIAQMEDPKISTFSVRIARFGDHELIDFRSREIDPFHAAYPFSQQAARLRKGGDGGIYLDRQRNSVVEGAGASLPDFSNLMYLPSDLVDRVLVPDPSIWAAGARGAGLDPAGARVERAVTRDDAGNIVIEERFTHSGILVERKPIKGLRRIVYAPADEYAPVEVRLELAGRIAQDWKLEWRRDDAQVRLVSLTALHHFYLYPDQPGVLMASAKYRPVRERELSAADIAEVFDLELPVGRSIVRPADASAGVPESSSSMRSEPSAPSKDQHPDHAVRASLRKAK